MNKVVGAVAHTLGFAFGFAVALLVWIGPSFLVGRFAANKGRSFGLFFAAALLLSWPIVLVGALVIPRRHAV
jgi:hypothetical protein